MLINRDKKQSEHVKFISYDGKYPCLCYGTLTLEINGKTYKFGDNTGNDFGPFWTSGGSAYFTNDYSDSVVEEDEWNIDVEDIPQEFRCYAEEIDRVFNDNVRHGCCGGCL